MVYSIRVKKKFPYVWGSFQELWVGQVPTPMTQRFRQPLGNQVVRVATKDLCLIGWVSNTNTNYVVIFVDSKWSIYQGVI